MLSEEAVQVEDFDSIVEARDRRILRGAVRQNAEEDPQRLGR